MAKWGYGHSQSITVIAALLLGIIYGGFVLWSSFICAQRWYRYNTGAVAFMMKNGPITNWRLISESIWPVLWSFLVFGFLARGIIFAFSKRLNGRMDLFRREWFTDDFWTLSLIILIPVLSHYLIMLMGTKGNIENQIAIVKQKIDDYKNAA